MDSTRTKLRMMILAALFAAIIAIMAQMIIPLPLVPITGQTLAVGLAAVILGSKYGALSALLYMLLGAIGLPVFSGASGGPGVIIGPTGGYIVSFIISAWLIGYYVEKTSSTTIQAFIANLIGMLINLFIGTVWLKLFLDLSWTAAYASGFIPFIAGGILKAILAAWIGITVRNRLTSARLLAVQA